MGRPAPHVDTTFLWRSECKKVCGKAFTFCLLAVVSAGKCIYPVVKFICPVAATATILY